MNKTCIVIVGPTAVGKTSIAIQLAQYFNTEIISCDSRQCYQELNIGVAKPSAKELALVPHHFINSHSIHEEVNAAAFEKYALEKVTQIFKQQTIAVMVGGTGLYVKAFCDGMDEVPETTCTLRSELNNQYKQFGIKWLQDEVAKADPLFFAQGEIKNPHRLLRALEVKLTTGKSILEFQIQQKKYRDFNVIKVGLQLERELLVERINKRVDLMMQEGLLEEVQQLQNYKTLNALQTVGYKELFSYLNNEISLPDAIEAIKINTRQYAKRQMTWFKKDQTVNWHTASFEEILTTLKKIL